MANEQNLIPKDSNQNREEAKRNGRKGGIASGKARRRKKAMREAAAEMLSATVPDEMLKKLVQMGMDKDSDQYCDAVVFAQIAKAVNGNTGAATFLAELMGEKTQNINVNSEAQSQFADVMEIWKKNRVDAE